LELVAYDPVVPIEQVMPGSIAEFGCLVGRSDHVREQHGLQDPGRLRTSPRAGDELLDLVSNSLPPFGPGLPFRAGVNFDVHRVLDVLGDVSGTPRRVVVRVAAPMQDQGRNVKRREDRADVCVHELACLSDHRTGSHRGALEACLPP
jgi:hypothetical protein